MFAGSCTLLGLFFLPETFAPVLLTRKAKRLRRANPEKNKDLYTESERVSWAPRAVLERTIFRPFKMLLVEPILLLATIYLSVTYGVIYASTFSWLLQTSYAGLTIVVCSVSGNTSYLHPHASLFHLK